MQYNVDLVFVVMRLSATYSWVPKPADRKLVQQQTAEEVKRPGIRETTVRGCNRISERRHDIVANLKACNIVPSKFDSAAKIEASFLRVSATCSFLLHCAHCGTGGVLEKRHFAAFQLHQDL